MKIKITECFCIDVIGAVNSTRPISRCIFFSFLSFVNSFKYSHPTASHYNRSFVSSFYKTRIASNYYLFMFLCQSDDDVAAANCNSIRTADDGPRRKRTEKIEGEERMKQERKERKKRLKERAVNNAKSKNELFSPLSMQRCRVRRRVTSIVHRHS